MTLAELDRLRQEATEALEEMRRAESNVPVIDWLGPNYQPLATAAARFGRARHAADRAVLEWIAQGCKEFESDEVMALFEFAGYVQGAMFHGDPEECIKRIRLAIEELDRARGFINNDR